MTKVDAAPRAETHRSPDERRQGATEGRDEQRLPTWANTRPPANPEPHLGDLQRSLERMEALLGR